MTQRGIELTIERPSWTDQLGPVPATNKHLKRWRPRRGDRPVPREVGKLSPPTTPPPSRTSAQRRGRPDPSARVTALHKSTALLAARGNDRTVDVTAQLNKAKTSPAARPERPIRRRSAPPLHSTPHRDQLAKKLDDLRKRTADLAASASESTSAATDQAATAVPPAVPLKKPPVAARRPPSRPRSRPARTRPTEPGPELMTEVQRALTPNRRNTP
jgi:hypothetical protein